MFLPSAWAARSSATSCWLSKPALSAMMVGSWRSALAKACMAAASLPAVLRARFSTAVAISISEQPGRVGRAGGKGGVEAGGGGGGGRGGVEAGRRRGKRTGRLYSKLLRRIRRAVVRFSSSDVPPPKTVRVSLTVWVRTHSAS